MTKKELNKIIKEHDLGMKVVSYCEDEKFKTIVLLLDNRKDSCLTRAVKLHIDNDNQIHNIEGNVTTCDLYFIAKYLGFELEYFILA